MNNGQQLPYGGPPQGARLAAPQGGPPPTGFGAAAAYGSALAGGPAPFAGAGAAPKPFGFGAPQAPVYAAAPPAGAAVAAPAHAYASAHYPQPPSAGGPWQQQQPPPPQQQQQQQQQPLAFAAAAPQPPRPPLPAVAAQPAYGVAAAAAAAVHPGVGTTAGAAMAPSFPPRPPMPPAHSAPKPFPGPPIPSFSQPQPMPQQMAPPQMPLPAAQPYGATPLSGVADGYVQGDYAYAQAQAQAQQQMMLGTGGLDPSQSAHMLNQQGPPQQYYAPEASMEGQSTMPMSPTQWAQPAAFQQHQQQQRPLIPEGVSPMHPLFLSPTLAAVGNSAGLRSSCKVPFGVVIQPLADPAGPGSLRVVNFGAAGVVRCKACRGYINPYVLFTDGGSRWVCNLCGTVNEVPAPYFSPLDTAGRRQDLAMRPELTDSSVEMVATAEYMMRPPMPPVYVFVLDVSRASHDSGMLRVATETLKSMLDRLPGGNRTNVAFVTFNSSVHFYSFKAGARAPQMFVATDLDDIFLPAPVDLLVNLHDCRALIEDFLDLLPIMHSKRRDVESALGPALEAAANVMASLGGKMLVFLSGLPSLGEGRLANRDNPRLFGSAKENTLQQPASDVYKKKAIKFTRFQITVDLFLFGDVFMDVATLAALPQTTGGQLNYYPSFHHASDGERFQRDLSRNLLRTTAWEAVMRVRVSAGFQVSAFYGNMFLRSPDLMSLPVTDSDKAYVVELRSPANKDVAQPFVTIQAALLYTSSEGERRIRVHTTVVPVVSSLLDLYKASQSSAIINLVAKQAVEQVAPEGFHRARELIRSTTMGIVRSWRAVQQQSFQAGAALPEALTTLALLALGTLKTPAFRDASDVRSDERADMLNVIRTLGLSALETLVRPRMMAVHELKAQEGLVEEKSQAVVFPPELSLSASQLPSDGCVLIDNGLRIFLRFGRAVSPAFVSTLFGVKSLEDVDMRSLRLLEPSAGDNSSALARLRALISNLRSQSPFWQPLYFFREGDPHELAVYQMLIEDRGIGTVSFAEFVQQLLSGPA